MTAASAVTGALAALPLEQAASAIGEAAGRGLATLDLAGLAAVAAALGWASGLRLYLVVFLTGLAGWLGWVALPGGLAVLQHPLVLVASGALLVLEFAADKIPGVDSVWDAIHTVIRIPAGAALAAATFGGDHQAWALVAALAGGTLAAASHTAKATTRAAANTSPEPFSNLGLSLAGDAVVPAMLWLSWSHPIVFFAVLAVALVLGLAVTVVLWRFLRGLAGRLSRAFTPASARAPLA